jgi:pimeloyl-ACP methyl ester carboxylesterase
MWKVDLALQEAGFKTLNVDYRSRKRPLEVLADEIRPIVTDFAGTIAPLHIVAHSMGGLLARVYLARYNTVRCSRMVMLGTPNEGSEVADLLKDLALYRAFYGPAGQQVTTDQSLLLTSLPPPSCAVGIVAGNRTLDPIASYFIVPRPNDGRVSVARTRLDGMADHVVIGASHSGLLTNHAAIAQTTTFLREGVFACSASPAN